MEQWTRPPIGAGLLAWAGSLLGIIVVAFGLIRLLGRLLLGRLVAGKASRL
jgi:hypothetical protein